MLNAFHLRGYRVAKSREARERRVSLAAIRGVLASSSRLRVGGGASPPIRKETRRFEIRVEKRDLLSQGVSCSFFSLLLSLFAPSYANPDWVKEEEEREEKKKEKNLVREVVLEA